MPYLNESDPRWDQASGGHTVDGHPQWGPEDVDRAADLLAEMRPAARRMFDHLVRHPGLEVHCAELELKCLGGPEAGKNTANRVASTLRGLTDPAGATGRRLPFEWWKAPAGGVGATYAVRPSVAAIFLAALVR
ncbi:DUF6416 domain-containing protein [Streptomyces sp. NPDC001581]|uniref:DUF6416 domain-containing protein n=1 Tax=Streptomyces sp. NPDC001581 TaxID=3154386 RepID=UPI00331F3473